MSRMALASCMAYRRTRSVLWTRYRVPFPLVLASRFRSDWTHQVGLVEHNAIGVGDLLQRLVHCIARLLLVQVLPHMLGIHLGVFAR